MTMALANGTRLGPYEIVAPLGAGGMGEVYRARDTRLARTVAIKVLPAHLAADPQFRERFDREAHAIAALNHPHICALYDVGEAPSPEPPDTIRFLVMEYLEGETLAARLAKGALPLDQVLRYAVEIADALDKAHRAAIVHRDLKPGNVMLTKAGAKLLDFGLARTGAGGPGGAGRAGGVTALPTEAPLTGAGTILGTFQYMAPEQLEGQEADARSDMFAFGAVVYEMATGKKAFEGKSQASLIAAILEHDPPPIAATQPLTPPSLDRIVKKCLAKDPDRRWQTARDLGDELTWVADAASHTGGPAPVVVRRATRRERIAWSAAAVLAVAALALGRVTYVTRDAFPPEAPETRLQVVTPGGGLTQFATSPDGRALVYVATVEGRTQLWLRPLDAEAAQPLAGTEGASVPFWSPDSRSIAFFNAGQLKRFDSVNGLVQKVTAVTAGMGGSWSSQGGILFSPAQTMALYRVPAEGGTAVEATHLDPPRQTGHRFPSFLPDGRHFFFYSVGAPGTKGLYVGSIDSTQTRRLLDADSRATFSPPDWILFARQGALFAQRLDLSAVTLLGGAQAVAAHVAVDPVTGGSVALSASLTGPVAYRASAEQRQFVWLDRSGRQIGTIGGADAAQPVSIRLSPDGRTVALARTVSGNMDVWLLDTARGVRTRFSTDAAMEDDPVWSPDGRRVVFESYRQGVVDLFEKAVAGDAAETLLLASTENKNPADWSPDGRFILYEVQSAKTARDLWALPLDGDRRPVSVAQTPAAESQGRFSPDGRWIAYQSNESGQYEIYVQRFPNPGDGKLQVSTSGGTTPRWRRDGRELFYRANGRLMAVPITLSSPRVEVGTAVVLFSDPRGASQYDVTADGQRFLFDTVVTEASPITILMNWKGSRHAQ
jgi:Tol biopolymer transport system component